MILEVKTAILNSGDFLPANEVVKLAGVSAVNPTLQPNKWKRDQDIFAIRHGREDYFPLYALNPDDHRPRKQMAEILRIFGDAKDGWGLAFWFAALNSFLDRDVSFEWSAAFLATLLGATLLIGSTIVYNPGRAGDIVPAVTSLGFNLIGGDPQLGPLQDNGGPTFMHAPLPGSPVIDQGKNFVGSDSDQRGNGFFRTVDFSALPNASGGDGTDIGAVEVQ